MNIAIGSDHNGFEMKEAIKKHLENLGYQVADYGCHSRDAVDYPAVAFEVAKGISEGKHDRGILICGTGLGVAIAANKYPGIRAATTHDTYSAERAQLSNNAQIITMGAQVIGHEAAKKIAEAYLNVSFDENSRSAPKVRQIIAREKEFLNSGAAIGKPDRFCN
ncbi:MULTISPECIES: ribose 5-phosphate isomerase B [Cohnella]|jgi:ribose 5-phosphate isomerase B|uniref:ribose 5-phosphate isomerase B n=1 Tax=Cohnella TaxID=329857 RepID=UPI000376F494|nr:MULTISPECIES: ribose 5-phosphate isomerase B [Cohnella]REK65337.1 MAG: ribose 5-phosphate isomerase B [Cohnella sp.]